MTLVCCKCTALTVRLVQVAGEDVVTDRPEGGAPTHQVEAAVGMTGQSVSRGKKAAKTNNTKKTRECEEA